MNLRSTRWTVAGPLLDDPGPLAMASRSFEAGKGLYRRIDGLLASLGTPHAPEYFSDALRLVYTVHAQEFDLSGA